MRPVDGRGTTRKPEQSVRRKVRSELFAVLHWPLYVLLVKLRLRVSKVRHEGVIELEKQRGTNVALVAYGALKVESLSHVPQGGSNEDVGCNLLAAGDPVTFCLLVGHFFRNGDEFLQRMREDYVKIA